MFVTLCISWIVLGPFTASPIEEDKLYTSVVEVFKKAKDVEILSIEPETIGTLVARGDKDAEKYKDPKVGFQERKPLGRTSIKEADLVDKVKKSVLDSIHTLPKEERTLCFIPRHGLRVKSGNDVVELLVCFECMKVYIDINGKALPEYAIKKDTQKLFNQILKDAKVPLADGAEKDEKEKKDE